MTSLILDRVRKAYGSTPVLDGVSLTMAANEFVAFLGPSGSGKSTLLRIIAGLETLDDGEVRLGDRRIDALPPGARDVAMVFQHYALYPHMTVRENMAFGLRNAKVPASEIATRIAQAAKVLEVEPLLDRKPGAIVGRPAPARRHRPRDHQEPKRCSCSTNRCRTSTPRCATALALSSRSCASVSMRRSSW